MTSERESPSYSIVIAPSDGGRTRQFTVSRVALRMWAGLGVAIVILALLEAVLLSVSFRASGEVADLRARNDSLVAAFGRLNDIDRQLRELESSNAQIRELAGIPQGADPAFLNDVADSIASARGRVRNERWSRSQPSLAPCLGPMSRQFVGDEGEEHFGVDVPGRVGAPILASGGGIVQRANNDEAFGNVLVIDHGGGVESLYAHNDSLLVSVGDSIRMGEPIALLGNTGRSTAPHLHFEVRIDGVPVDPASYIKLYRQ